MYQALSRLGDDYDTDRAEEFVANYRKHQSERKRNYRLRKRLEAESRIPKHRPAKVKRSKTFILSTPDYDGLPLASLLYMPGYRGIYYRVSGRLLVGTIHFDRNYSKGVLMEADDRFRYDDPLYPCMGYIARCAYVDSQLPTGQLNVNKPERKKRVNKYKVRFM